VPVPGQFYRDQSGAKTIMNMIEVAQRGSPFAFKMMGRADDDEALMSEKTQSQSNICPLSPSANALQ
jgi:hypothetical protein